MKQRLLLVFKILVSAGLIVWLIHKTDLHAVGRAIRECPPSLLALVVLAIAVGNIAQVLRWRVLVSESVPDARFGRLFRYHFIGVFFQSFLPSSMSVDIVKGYLLSKSTDRNKAYGSVIFARFLGATVLFLFFAGVLILRPAVILDKGFTHEILWGLTLFCAASAVVFSKKVSRFLFGRFPRFSRTSIFLKAKAFREELYAYRARPGALILAVLLSAVIFFFSILSAWISFKAVGLQIPFLACMVTLPLVYAFMLMPVSLNGIGVREGLMLLFLAPFGMNFEALMGSSAIVYAVIYAFSLAGGVVYLMSDLKGADRVQKEA